MSDLGDEALNEHADRSLAARSDTPESPQVGLLTISRPTVPHGPKGVHPDQATADYLNEAARRVIDQRLWGSNVTATVAGLLRDVADRLVASLGETAQDPGHTVSGLSMTERESLWRAGDHSPEVCDCTGYASEAGFEGDDVCEAFRAQCAAAASIVTARQASHVEAVALLRAAFEAESAATPAPWHQEFYRDGEILPDGTGGLDDHETPGSGVYAIDKTSPEGYCLTEFDAVRSADAALIVALRNVLPALRDVLVVDKNEHVFGPDREASAPR